MASVVCPHCGTPNAAGNAFCQSCGQPLSGAASAGVPPQQPPPGGGMIPEQPPQAAMPPQQPPAGVPPQFTAQPPGAQPPQYTPPAGGVPPQGAYPPQQGAYPQGAYPPQQGAYPPGVYPQPGYQSPYYTPAAAARAAPVHRLPLAAILGSVVGVLGVVTAALVLLLHPFGSQAIGPIGPTSTTTTTTTTTQTTTTTTQGGGGSTTTTTTQGGGGSTTTTDTGTTTTDTGSATTDTGTTTTDTGSATTDTGTTTTDTGTTDTGTSGGGGTSYSSDKNTVTVQAPAPWQLTGHNNVSITLADSDFHTGTLWFEAGTLKSPTTAQAYADSTLADLKSKFPDAAYCKGGSPQNAKLNGPSGVFYAVCFTVTPQGGQAIPAAAVFFDGLNSAGTTVYIAEAEFAASESAFFKEAQKVVATVKWTLP